MSYSQNFYSNDFFNIEEVPSFLEMEAYLRNTTTVIPFKIFIKDVISHYTPPMKVSYSPNQTITDFMPSGVWGSYGFFVSSLFNIRVREETWNQVEGERKQVNHLE